METTQVTQKSKEESSKPREPPASLAHHREGQRKDVNKIAFVNTGRYTGSRGVTSFSDPIHLVTMHNQCKKFGHCSKIFQLGSPTLEASIEAIKHFAPDILGLSFLAPFKSDIDAVERLLAPFCNKNVRLFLGGPDIQFDPNFYISAFASERAKEWLSCVLVEGPGERLIAAIAPHGFDVTHPLAQKTFQTEGIRCQKQDGAFLIQGLRELPLDEQEYIRDYDLAPFNNKAGVKWATGCWAACSFCPNIPGRSQYKSASIVTKEVRYLIQLGAKKLDIASPQFTAHPDRASEVINALPPETPSLFFSSRIDSLYRAITRHPDIWKRFANSHPHGIGLGVDSFLPNKLMRLRKYHTVAQANAQKERLETVLQFFSVTKLNIVFYMIMFDWEMNLEEVIQELQELLHCMNRYASIMQISPENVTNTLTGNKGSYFSTTRKPIDFLRFERDPRLFVMVYSMYTMHELLEEDIEQSNESRELLEAAAARSVAKFGLQLANRLKKIDSSKISFNHSFSLLKERLGSMFQGGRENYSSRLLRDELLSVYPVRQQQKIKKFLAKEEKIKNKKRILEFDELLTRKALHRLFLQGKISRQMMEKKLRKFK